MVRKDGNGFCILKGSNYKSINHNAWNLVGYYLKFEKLSRYMMIEKTTVFILVLIII